MKENEIQDELAAIRGLMERSSKFISLSGLSGILAGVYALIGAGIVYYMIYAGLPSQLNPYIPTSKSDNTIGLFYGASDDIPWAFLLLALLLLILAIGTGVLLTIRKAKRNGQSIWSPTSRTLLFHMATPLVAGGLLILVLLSRGYYGIVAPASLIFYGLALISASNFTFTDVKYLGLCEIALGLAAACLPGYGLLFWALGFGVLHIIYGGMMYLKYDR